MSRYREFGSLDDRISDDLDTSFVGFNNRTRPDQLPAGMLQESRNARLDLNGQWQTRKGTRTILAPFVVEGSALRLPTTEQEQTLGGAQTATAPVPLSSGVGYLAFKVTNVAKAEAIIPTLLLQ